MTDQEKQEYLDFAKKLAHEAGEIMRKHFHDDPKEWLKEDKSLVTVADEEVNQLVIDRINSTYPTHTIDGEEISFEGESKEHVWACDPIDGTKPYSLGLPTSVFSLALIISGKLVVAVVYEPHSDSLYSASAGGGAYINDRKIQVNDKKLTDDATLSCSSWQDIYQPKPIIMEAAERIGFKTLNIGSVTHASALVARGSFVATIFGGTKDKNVDMAAVALIVQEAGGVATDLFGNDQRYDQDINGCIVSNGVVHDEIVSLFKDNINKLKVSGN